VLGDDLALNAQQVTGVRSAREIPVVLAVAKGSAVNKAILVPAALLISAVAPWLITPLLMLGGAYLCYEGWEKVSHKYLHTHAEEDAEARHTEELKKAMADPNVDLVALERKKIKGAIRTDFILSAEIVVLTLGTMGDAGFLEQVVVLVLIAALMTVGVYGLVAGIVKLDDLGIYLSQKESEAQQRLGAFILWGAPHFMRALGVAGTIAMFLVGGGILTHGLHEMMAALHHLEGFFGAVLPTLVDFLAGIAAGALIVGAIEVIGRLRGGAES
jgi:predicted DNA repair protein MutK